MHNYLSIDIGGTAIKAGLINHSGNLIEKVSVETPQNLEDFVRALMKIITKYQDKIAGVALSVPGKVDSKNGIVYFGGSLPFLDRFDFTKFVQNEIGIIPVRVENDGKSAALAELWVGNLKNKRNAAAIILGTGVGGGIIINGRLLPGSHFQAGELSFMMSDFNQISYEKMVGSSLSAVEMIKKIAKKKKLGNKKDGLAVFELINAGEQEAYNIFKEYCKNIAMLILNVQTVVDLTDFVIGGGISGQPILVKTINDEYDKMLNEVELIKSTLTRPKIVKAKFENNANLYGSLYGLLQQLDNNSKD